MGRSWTILPRLSTYLILSVALVGILPGRASGLGRGRPAPDFVAADIEGRDVTLHTLRGQNILLFFGTTWCPHCVAALPILENLSKVFDDTELNVLFVAVHQNAEDLVEFFAGKRPIYTVCLDEAGAIGEQYGIKRVPICVFVGKDGLIQYVGQPNEDVIWHLLSGGQADYIDALYGRLQPANRVAQMRHLPSSTTKRLVVELDEEPGLFKRLSKEARQSRRAQLRQAVQRIGGRVVHNYGRLENKIVVEVPGNKVEELRGLPRFKSLKQDRRVYALLEDSAYQIKADYAWDNAITGQGVKVCVVDTGIDYRHPDLQNKVVAQYDFTTGTEDAMDDCGHGTHCAGIIASQGIQFRGVSYDVALMGAKVLDYSGNGYASDVILGINWCVEQGADVISLSLGEGLYRGTCDDDEMAQAVNTAVEAGVVVVCAAGNDGDTNAMVSPACASKAIAVGAVDKIDNIASYSDGGAELDLVAPGGDYLGGIHYPEIVSTFSTEVANNPLYCLYWLAEECYDNYLVVDGMRYIRAIGTSMATPHVAGAAALLLEENPYLTPSEIKTVLEQNADDLGPPGWDNVYGWGRINVKKALDNMPAEPAELTVNITEPNASATFMVDQEFALTAEVDCLGGEGCGEVLAHAQFCSGRDCNDFADIAATTTLSTTDDNPARLGNLSGFTFETDVNAIFDVQTTLDISEQIYTKSLNPDIALVGSTLTTQYNTGDLEPNDGLGAIGEDAQKIYQFQIPPGVVRQIKVKMEHYLVLQFDEPPAGWYIFTSNVDGDSLNLIGECIPISGGGGEPPPPDCWLVCDDPGVLADLNPGGTSYVKLMSHDVGDNDWLAFNDIEVVIEYEIDPDNDEVNAYYIKLELSEVDTSAEVTAARFNINIAEGSEGCVGEVFVVDSNLAPTDPAEEFHNPPDPCYWSLTSPVKSFSCESAGAVSLNVQAAVEEALINSQDTIAFQIRERNNDQLFAIHASGSEDGPLLTVSQRVKATTKGFTLQHLPSYNVQIASEPNSEPYGLTYDSMVVKDLSEGTYVKYDNPVSASVGSQMVSEYNTGDLEPEDGLGAIGEDAQKIYEFEIPSGAIRRIKVKMEHYLVLQFDEPPAGWYIFTSDVNGGSLNLVGECTPISGGGGEPPPPDCWVVCDDPAALADLRPGGTNYIKLVSHNVGENDWLTFNDIEVIVEYEIDPNNDNISRYHVKFDISELGSDLQLDSAILNLYVTDPAEDATAEISLVDNAYDQSTGAYTIYHAEDADYSSLVNPIKSLACDDPGPKQINVRAALEDAVESSAGQIAFLITEKGENALFTIDAGAGSNPPRLDVYLKSSISSGLAEWVILSAGDGSFTLRAVANSSSGIIGASDAVVINVSDPNRPVISSVDCLVNSAWKDCRSVQYGDILQAIRIDASDPQEVPNVYLKLRNIPDDRYFVDDQVRKGVDYFVYDTSLEISDSGEWQIEVRCIDSDGNTDTETVTWNVPWGRLESYLIGPTDEATVPKSSSFSVAAGARCLEAECPSVNVYLRLNEPIELKYDDGTAEDYGDIGSNDGYLGVRFTPASYPVTLRAARFYVWDETTYAFELHVWGDSGFGGAPGTDLITPVIVDPVVSSSYEEVAWFDVDLSTYNITIDSGNFFIGWRQLEEYRNNQVGFDTTGERRTRTWGYLPSLGWFNLDEFCWFAPEYCGNIMIRALLGSPGSREGTLPTAVGAAPFYTLDDHPYPCPDMDANDVCEATFQVYATGAVAEDSTLDAVFANDYSYDNTAAIKVIITEPATPCDAANLNAVGSVEFGDLAVLACQWLQASPLLSADVNGDGSVDILDLVSMASYWLDSCN